MKNMRKLLSAIMALAMVATLLPAVTVEANAAVTTEAELFAAIDAAPAEGVVIDLEGKTVELASALAITDKKVTIQNGSINSAGKILDVLGTSEVVLKNVACTAASYGIYVKDDAKLTLIEGTKISSSKIGVRCYHNATVTIDGAEIVSKTQSGINVATNVTVNLISGSVSSEGSFGVQINGGTLNMSGGTVSSTGKKTIITASNDANAGPVAINISGGTVEGQIRLTTPVNALYTSIALNISGDAVITGNVADELAVYSAPDTTTLTSASITGGSFTGYVNLPVTDALAGCITGGTFSVAPYDHHIKAGYAYIEGKVVSNLCDGKPGSCASSHLTDVPTTHDNHSAVDYVVSKGLMAGFGGNVFAPDTKMDWSMAVQVLYNMAGQPAVTFKAPFSDVTAANWYANAVQWAVDNGIVEAGSTFGPTAEISAAEFGTILKFYGQNVKKADISAWSGVGSTAATVTRGQAAKMLQGFHSICG